MILHPFITEAILAKTIMQNASLFSDSNFFAMVFCEKCNAFYKLFEHTECPVCAEEQERMNATPACAEEQEHTECPACVEEQEHTECPEKRRRVQERGIYVEIAAFPLPGDPPQPSLAESCHQPRPSSLYQQTPSTAAAAVYDSSPAITSLSDQLLLRLHQTIVANRKLLQPYQNLRRLPNHRYTNQQPVPESTVSTASAPNASDRPLPFRVSFMKKK